MTDQLDRLKAALADRYRLDLEMRFSTAVVLAWLVAGCDSEEILDPARQEPDPNDGLAHEIAFVDRTIQAGFISSPSAPSEPDQEELAMQMELAILGGVAAGDFDADGDVDLFLVSDGSGDNLLFRNKGDGTFEEVGAQYGVNRTPVYESGPLFVDYDGDGHLDLIIGGVRRMSDWEEHNSVTVFRNTGVQSFVDVTPGTGLILPPEVDTYSLSAGDVDDDNHLDLFLSHWRVRGARDSLGEVVTVSHGRNFLWKNNGDGSFTDITGPSGLDDLQFTFTANFSDIDSDHDLDLLVASDFQSSVVLRNDGGRFVEQPNSVLTDGNGMGASVGDYDNDGDLDWFVTSIWDPNGIAEGTWDVSGNRLYQNDGRGQFTDVSDVAGVREGYWGWASCFADFDNDGNLDVFHVNGMQADANTVFGEFWADPSRLFMSNGDGTFTERSSDFGLGDAGQGRGVVCFDADRDGDIDIFVANNQQPARFYANEGTNVNNYLEIVLRGTYPNTQGIGARIVVVTGGGGTQVREIRAGGNFVSQNPAEAHFGLGQEEIVSEVLVRWPDGQATVLHAVAANQLLVISHPGM